jgi:ribosomal protein L35
LTQVGPRYARLFKILPTGRKHLRRNKSKNQLNRYKRVKYVAKADTWRVKKMLPYWKRQKFKNNL